MLMNRTCHIIVRVYEGLAYYGDAFKAFFIKRAMGSCGKNVLIKPTSSIFKGLENVFISNDVRIARNAVIYSTEAKVFIGSKVGIAPNVKIITGNHRTDVPGHYMFDADYSKCPEDDRDVTIEGDNWLGINVTLLSGVTVGRGSVIAADSVLTKSCPPYSIMGGVPAKVLRWRFSIEEVLEHEAKLYPKEKRMTREQIEASRNN